MNETPVWNSRSSQVTNLGAFLLCAGVLIALVTATLLLALPVWCLIAAVLPVLWALFQWLKVQSKSYSLTTERLQVSSGILSRRIDSLELYRVKDITVLVPLSQRIFGLGDVVLSTSDHTTPQVILHAVSHPQEVTDLIRTHVELQRAKKRVTELDVNPESQ